MKFYDQSTSVVLSHWKEDSITKSKSPKIFLDDSLPIPKTPQWFINEIPKISPKWIFKEEEEEYKFIIPSNIKEIDSDSEIPGLPIVKTKSPKILTPIWEFLTPEKENMLFSIREEVDNLIFNEKGFTMYAWFGTNDLTNDKEIEFLLSLSNQIDISNFLISKTFIKIGASASHVFELLQNPNKYKVFNA